MCRGAQPARSTQHSSLQLERTRCTPPQPARHSSGPRSPGTSHVGMLNERVEIRHTTADTAHRRRTAAPSPEARAPRAAPAARGGAPTEAEPRAASPTPAVDATCAGPCGAAARRPPRLLVFGIIVTHRLSFFWSVNQRRKGTPSLEAPLRARSRTRPGTRTRAATMAATAVLVACRDSTCLLYTSPSPRDS